MVKKKISKDKKIEKDAEKVCETFEVGDKKVVEKCGEVPKEHLTKNELKNNQKILRDVLIIMVILIIALIGGYFAIKSLSHFKYEGMKFDVQKEGDVLFYHTSFPVYEGAIQVANYNAYLRTNPRDLEKIDFEGELKLRKMMILNTSQEFVCRGDGIISVVNMNQIFGKGFGITIGKDSNATCDELGRYGYIYLLDGEETKIEQYGPACYKLYIKDCEILPVTERFILEALKKTV